MAVPSDAQTSGVRESASSGLAPTPSQQDTGTAEHDQPERGQHPRQREHARVAQSIVAGRPATLDAVVATDTPVGATGISTIPTRTENQIGRASCRERV